MSSRTWIGVCLLLAGVAVLATVVLLAGNNRRGQAEAAERDIFGAPVIEETTPGPTRTLPEPRPLPPVEDIPEPQEPWEPPEILASGG